MQTIGDRIRKIEELFRLKSKDFAEILRISQSHVSEIESGKAQPSKSLIRAISFAFGISEKWLVTGEGPIFEGVPLGMFALVPRYSIKVSGGVGHEVIETKIEEIYAFRKDWLKKKGNPNQMVLVKASGDSMEPTICDGDLVLVDRERTTIRNERIYVIRIENQYIVKRLRTTGNKIEVLSDNRLYPPFELDLSLENVEIVGEVIWIGRELLK